MCADNKDSFGLLDKEISHYWEAYGGLRAIRRSPYLWLAFAITLWTQSLAPNWKWHATAISVLPNLLGFSLGGYAMMLALGNSKFQDTIRGEDPPGETSPYMKISATMAHFVLIQLASLIYSIIYESIEIQNLAFSAIGCWLLHYALLLGIAATMSIFFLSRMYDKHPKKDNTSSQN